MGKTILYPFLINQDNTSSYFKTLEMAKKLAANVVCFTTVPNEQSLDKAYLYLLNLNGQFQTGINNWQPTEINIHRNIAIGNLEKELGHFLEEEKIDMVVSQTKNERLNYSFLSRLINQSNYSPILLNFESDL